MQTETEKENEKEKEKEISKMSTRAKARMMKLKDMENWKYCHAIMGRAGDDAKPNR